MFFSISDFNRLGDIEGARCGAVGRVVAGGQQSTRLVEHRDVVDAEAGYGSCDEVAHGRRGMAGDVAAGADDDGRCRLLFACSEVPPLGHDDVDPRVGYAVDRFDRAGDFALERTHTRDLLHEGGEAERAHVVEQFVTGGGAARQAALGEKHPGAVLRVGGHTDARAIGAHSEGDIGGRERRAHLRGVVALQTDIEGFVGRLPQIKGRADDHRESQCRSADDRQHPVLAEGGDVPCKDAKLVQQIHSVSDMCNRLVRAPGRDEPRRRNLCEGVGAPGRRKGESIAQASRKLRELSSQR